MPDQGRIFVVSSPSGGGKTTLLNHVLETVPGVTYSISATTRAPRPGEEDGRHYFFLTEEQFQRRIAEGAFAEWQRVHGNYYGTPIDFVRETVNSGRHLLMDIDVYGKKKFDAVFPEAVGILILPPSLEELGRRLRERGQDSEEAIVTRLGNARDEMEFARREGKYEYRVINDELRRAESEIVSIVFSEIAHS